MIFEDIFGNLFHYVHVSIIHFPIVTFIFASVSGLLAFLMIILSHKPFFTKINDDQKYQLAIQIIEIISIINLLLGELSIPIVAFMGLYDAKSVEIAVTTDLLAFKIQLTMVAFCLFSVPLIYKLYLMKKANGKIFENSILIPIFYLLPVLLGTALFLLIAGAGGRFVFGLSILDYVGLGFLSPEQFVYTFYYQHYPISFIADYMTQPIGIILTFILFLVLAIYPFRRKNLKNNQIEPG